MYTKRELLKVTAGVAAATALETLTMSPASAADDWRKGFSELRFAVRPNENAEGMTRWSALADYLSAALKTKVTLRQATDYAGIIEAINSKRLELAYLGGSGYAQAWLVTGGNVELIAAVLGADGDTGYYSMVVVKADSPYKTIDDLKGKSLAYGDPNSTSGFQVPSFFLHEEGKDPKTFFAKTGFTGTHENAVMAVYNGTYDAAATWFTTETRTAVSRMESKGLLPKDAMRVIWKSPKIEGDAFTVRKDLPQSLKDDVRAVLLAIPEKNPELLKLLGDGTFKGVVPIGHDAYVPLVTMVQKNQAERKQ